MAVEVDHPRSDRPDEAGQPPGVRKERPFRRQRKRMELDATRCQLSRQVTLTTAHDDRFEVGSRAKGHHPDAVGPAAEGR